MKDLPYGIVAEDLSALAAEFRRTPVGFKSPRLQRLMHVFRGEPVEGKFALFVVRPNREWMVMELPRERYGAPVFHEDKVFTNRAEAEWAVFKLRWERHFGVAVDED